MFAALAKPFQLVQAGNVRRILGGTAGHGPDVCAVAVMEKMFAVHGVGLRRRLWLLQGLL